MTRPKPDTSRIVESEDGSEGEAEPKMNLGFPVLWMVARDGLVRPIPVEVGLSDGMVTEVLSGNVEPDAPVVTGVVRKAERDFVSSFVVKVTNQASGSK